MLKLWMQARAKIRRSKSVTVILVVMFLIAALLLNVGLLVAVNYGSFFGQLKKELSPSDVYYAVPDAIYTDEMPSYLNANEHVEKVQAHEVLWLGADIASQGKDKSFNVLFQNMDEERKMSRWKYVGEHLPAQEMSVYIPDIFKAVSGYDLNDTISLTYTDEISGEKKTLAFTVKGYTEDIFFSSTDTGMMSFYLPEETYRQVSEILDHPLYRLHVLFTDLDEVKNASAVEGGLRELLNLNTASLISGDSAAMLVAIDIELIQLSRCMMATMVAAMMVLFALIVVAVCLLVVRYRIVNSIEDDMTKIGSLKAIGYTGGQIRLSLLLQYLLIAGVGSAAGIALSYPLLPAIAAVFEQQSGLKWEQGFDPLLSPLALLIILLIVVLAVLLATRRIGRLSPIRALRGETTVRKFRHNRLPLEGASGPLPATLAFKSVLQNVRQNIMVAAILLGVTFAGSFGVIMFYNTSVDTKAFAEVPGMEITNVIATLNTGKDQTDTAAAIGSMEAVRKTLYLDEVKLKVEGTEVSAYVMEDYTEKETRLVYEGRYPEKQNEIVLAGILSERLQKTVGDSVSVQFGDREETFLVTGLSNGSSMGGLNTCVLAGDYRRLNPDFQPQALYIYLEEGADSAVFIDTLKSRFDKEQIPSYTDFDKVMAEGMASYQNIVAAMGVVMLVITLVVVLLVLYFMISSSVIRQKRELGIQKAVGYTTFQLMNQLSLTYTVPVALGAAIGCVLGAYGTNPLMSVAMRGAGIMKANFIVDPLWIALFGIGTLLLAYLLSLLTTWRIRKISAYSLVTE
ncbi:MAG: ABC transporter permease [Clostridiales bacterium]|nr:ABC transporter permease [Clostridiales bacterium]